MPPSVNHYWSTYSPHRWLRNLTAIANTSKTTYSPHRWLRNEITAGIVSLDPYSPHRWLRKIQEQAV